MTPYGVRIRTVLWKIVFEMIEECLAIPSLRNSMNKERY